MAVIKQQKLEKTLVDYMAIAISPVLIMALVGSLIFFLLEVAYEGEFRARLRWSLFWFVLASVLISRISIEKSQVNAWLYGFLLAIVTGVVIQSFISNAIWVWLFLAVIWWCAGKLTWDCTLIDDDEDASGEGLLQVAKKAELKEDTRSDDHSVKGVGKKEYTPFWKRVFLNRSEREGQPHAPGLWVVYFSLAALPIFGVGQLMIGREDNVTRTFGFMMLIIYVMAGLGLLLTTSFLGLRRYLRQRRLQMPARMAASWIAGGSVLIASILISSVLLPRPDATYSLTSLVGKIGSPEKTDSDDSFLDDAAAEGIARLGFGDMGNRNRRGSQESESQSGQGQNSQNKNAQQQGPTQQQQGGSPSATIGNILKWIIYAIFAAAVLWMLFRFRRELMQGLKELIAALVNFIRGLFGWKPLPIGEAKSTEPSVLRPRRKPFSFYKNPFASGLAQQKSPAELVQYTFEALQSWAAHYGWERGFDQTPFEFSQYLSAQAPEFSDGVSELARLYSRVAYAGPSFVLESDEPLRRLWAQMSDSVRG